MIKLLRWKKGDRSVIDDSKVAGFTALHIAVFQGGVKTIQHLLDRRRVAWQPQNNLKYLMMTTSKAHGSLTALQIACILEDVECVKVLLKCEDEPRVTNLDYYLTDVYVPSETTAANIGAAMKVLPGSETAKISKFASIGGTLLDIAISNNNSAMLEILLTFYHVVFSETQLTYQYSNTDPLYNNTICIPLHKSGPLMQQQSMNVLMEHGVDPWPLLHTAVLKDDVNLLDLIINSGTTIDINGLHDGYTLLHLAARRYKPKVLSHLLTKYRGSIHINSFTHPSRGRITALQIACEHSSVLPAKLLLEHDADPNVRYDSQSPALYIAVEFHNHLLVEMLIDHGADPLEIYRERSTLQLIAAKQSHNDVTSMIINKISASLKNIPEEQAQSELRIMGFHLHRCLRDAIEGHNCDLVRMLICDYRFLNSGMLYPAADLVLTACLNACEPCLELLLNVSDVINSRDTDGKSILYHTVASMSESLDTIQNETNLKLFQHLLSHNVNVEELFLLWDDLDIDDSVMIQNALLLLCCGFKSASYHPTSDSLTLSEMLILHAVGVPIDQQEALSRVDDQYADCDQLYFDFNFMYTFDILHASLSVVTGLDVQDDATIGWHEDDLAKHIISQLVKHPRTLQNSCVITIRRTISRNVFYNSTKLPLPSKIIEMIKYVDLKDYLMG